MKLLIFLAKRLIYEMIEMKKYFSVLIDFDEVDFLVIVQFMMDIISLLHFHLCMILFTIRIKKISRG
jgi:hypothetical protein